MAGLKTDPAVILRILFDSFFLIFVFAYDKVAQHKRIFRAAGYLNRPSLSKTVGGVISIKNNYPFTSLLMKFLLGEKGRMTQIFEETGRVMPVTVIKVQPAVVTQVKTEAKDGYSAVQLGAGEKKEKNLTKAIRGHLADLGQCRYLREFRLRSKKEDDQWQRGQTVELSVIQAGDRVTVTSISKGKGFQGVVKRHGFAGGPRTHGQKHSEREPGSIGATGIQRVMKGKKMAGRMGGRQTTRQNVLVVRSRPETGELLLKGAVPGRPGSLVKIQGR